MKLKDFKNDIKVLDVEALLNKAKALKIEINDLVLDKNINRVKNLKSISAKKKDLARILTVVNQKQAIAALEPKAEVEEKPEAKSKTEKTEKGGKK